MRGLEGGSETLTSNGITNLLSGGLFLLRLDGRGDGVEGALDGVGGWAMGIIG